MLKLENSIRGLSFSRVAFDLTIQAIKHTRNQEYASLKRTGNKSKLICSLFCFRYSR